MRGTAKLVVGGTLVCYSKWLVTSLPHGCTGKEVGMSEVSLPLLGKLATCVLHRCTGVAALAGKLAEQRPS